jgi:pyruvate/2-oxoglutarate dehydrogenase complex dihydrolipoamide dehydrogenase (E3) component
MRDRYDLVVLGAGSAGLTAAHTGLALGGRIALIEAQRPGGDRLWAGCIPSKSLLAAATVAHTVRRASRFGVHVERGYDIDFAGVLAHVRPVQQLIEGADSVEALRTAGIDVLIGPGRFTSPTAVQFGPRRLAFRSALVATGSRPILPGLPGLADAPMVTADTVWRLERLPHRLVVLGAGPTGCELGQVFARLGVSVVLVEAKEHVLPGEGHEAARLLAVALGRDGVEVRTGSRALRWASGLVVAGPGGREQVLECDALLLATGRRPRTDGLGLWAAQVRLRHDGGIGVDHHLRTANARIFAAGDVTGTPAPSHVAAVQGSVAATNALLGPIRSAPVVAVSRVTFTDPEVAAVGLSATAARRRFGRAVIRRVRHGNADRALVNSRAEGLTELVGDATGRLVGVTVVGPHASEAVAELAALVRDGDRINELAAARRYPGSGGAPWLEGHTRA